MHQSITPSLLSKSIIKSQLTLMLSQHFPWQLPCTFFKHRYTPKTIKNFHPYHHMSIMPRRPLSRCRCFRKLLSHFRDVRFVVRRRCLNLLRLDFGGDYGWWYCCLSWHNLRFRAHFALRYWVAHFALILWSLNADAFFPEWTKGFLVSLAVC